jgi:hypothetical protein
MTLSGCSRIAQNVNENPDTARDLLVHAPSAFQSLGNAAVCSAGQADAERQLIADVDRRRVPPYPSGGRLVIVKEPRDRR